MMSFHLILSVQFSCLVVSNPERPHGLQHARLLCPSLTPRTCSYSCPLSWWLNSYYVQGIILNMHRYCWYWCCLVTKSCLTLLWPQGLQPTRLLCPWDFPGKNIGMDCHFLLQGIFWSRNWTVSPALQADSLLLSHQGSPYSLSKFQLYNSVINYSHHVLCYSFMLTFF